MIVSFGTLGCLLSERALGKCSFFKKNQISMVWIRNKGAMLTKKNLSGFPYFCYQKAKLLSTIGNEHLMGCVERFLYRVKVALGIKIFFKYKIWFHNALTLNFCLTSML